MRMHETARICRASYFSNRHFQVEHKMTDQFIGVHIQSKKALLKLHSNKSHQIQGLGQNFDIGIKILGTSILGF